MSIDTACSSSLVALDAALEKMDMDSYRSDALACKGALVAGINVMLTPHAFVSFCKTRMLSPDCRCKSFDAAANGYARGEGGGAVLLLPIAEAKSMEIPYDIVILSCATNHDGKSASLTAPNGLAQRDVLRKAWRYARLNPKKASALEAHGTGTALGDPIEASATKAIMCGEERQLNADVRLMIGSVKTNIGHLEGGAGIAGLLKATLTLLHEEIPRSLHFKTLNPHIDFSDVNVRIATTLTPLIAPIDQELSMGVSSFGFGGANAHAVIAKRPWRPANNDEAFSSAKHLPLPEPPCWQRDRHSWKQFIEDRSEVARTCPRCLGKSRNSNRSGTPSAKQSGISTPEGISFHLDADSEQYTVEGASNMEEASQLTIERGQLDEKIRKSVCLAMAFTIEQVLGSENTGSANNARELTGIINKLRKQAEGEKTDLESVSIQTAILSSLDSLSAMEFKNLLEEQLEMTAKLPISILFDHSNLADLMRAIEMEVIQNRRADGDQGLALSAERPFSSMFISQANTLPREYPEDLVVVGASLRLPGGVDTLSGLWDCISNEKVMSCEIPASRFEVNGIFDPKPGIVGKICSPNAFLLHPDDLMELASQQAPYSSEEWHQLDPQQRLALIVAKEALKTADMLRESNVSTYVGCCDGTEWQTLISMEGGPLHGVVSTSEHDLFTATANTMLASRIAHSLALNGAAMVVDSGCSSFISALQAAYHNILLGATSEAALVCGVSLIMTPLSLWGFNARKFLSRQGTCLPFDVRADGTVRGEGAVAIVVKQRQQVGNKYICTVPAITVKQNGRSALLVGFSGEGIRSVMMSTVSMGGGAPYTTRHVTHIETHGTGIPVADAIEVEATRAVYCNPDCHPAKLFVGASHGNFGHLHAVQGGVQLLRAALILAHGEVPPLAQFRGTLHPLCCQIPASKMKTTECMVFPTAKDDRTIANKKYSLVALSSFGMGGTNCHALIGTSQHSQSTLESVDKVLIEERSGRKGKSAPLDKFTWKPPTPLGVSVAASKLQTKRKNIPTEPTHEISEESIQRLRELLSTIANEEKQGVVFWNWEKLDAIVELYEDVCCNTNNDKVFLVPILASTQSYSSLCSSLVNRLSAVVSPVLQVSSSAHVSRIRALLGCPVQRQNQTNLPTDPGDILEELGIQLVVFFGKTTPVEILENVIKRGGRIHRLHNSSAAARFFVGTAFSSTVTGNSLSTENMAKTDPFFVLRATMAQIPSSNSDYYNLKLQSIVKIAEEIGLESAHAANSEEGTDSNSCSRMTLSGAVEMPNRLFMIFIFGILTRSIPEGPDFNVYLIDTKQFIALDRNTLKTHLSTHLGAAVSIVSAVEFRKNVETLVADPAISSTFPMPEFVPLLVANTLLNETSPVSSSVNEDFANTVLWSMSRLIHVTYFSGGKELGWLLTSSTHPSLTREPNLPTVFQESTATEKTSSRVAVKAVATISKSTRLSSLTSFGASMLANALQHQCRNVKTAFGHSSDANLDAPIVIVGTDRVAMGFVQQLLNVHPGLDSPTIQEMISSFSEEVRPASFLESFYSIARNCLPADIRHFLPESCLGVWEDTIIFEGLGISPSLCDKFGLHDVEQDLRQTWNDNAEEVYTTHRALLGRIIQRKQSNLPYILCSPYHLQFDKTRPEMDPLAALFGVYPKARVIVVESNDTEYNLQSKIQSSFRAITTTTPVSNEDRGYLREREMCLASAIENLRRIYANRSGFIFFKNTDILSNPIFCLEKIAATFNISREHEWFVRIWDSMLSLILGPSPVPGTIPLPPSLVTNLASGTMHTPVKALSTVARLFESAETVHLNALVYVLAKIRQLPREQLMGFVKMWLPNSQQPSKLLKKLRKDIEKKINVWKEELNANLTSSEQHGSNLDPTKRVVILTGATGFLGRFVLHKLLHDNCLSLEKGVKLLILCLIRCDNTEAGLKRLQAKFSESNLEFPTEQEQVSIEILPQSESISSPRLGVDEDNWKYLLEAAPGPIIHCASRVSLLGCFEGMEKTNCRPIVELLRLAMLSRTGKRTIALASSLGQFPEFVASFSPDLHSANFGDDEMEPENAEILKVIDDTCAPSFPLMQRTLPEWLAGYSWSKWVVDQLLTDLWKNENVNCILPPTVIWRFGHMLFSSESGFINHKDPLTKILRCILHQGILPVSNVDDVSLEGVYLASKTVSTSVDGAVKLALSTLDKAASQSVQPAVLNICKDSAEWRNELLPTKTSWVDCTSSGQFYFQDPLGFLRGRLYPHTYKNAASSLQDPVASAQILMWLQVYAPSLLEGQCWEDLSASVHSSKVKSLAPTFQWPNINIGELFRHITSIEHLDSSIPVFDVTMDLTEIIQREVGIQASNQSNDFPDEWLLRPANSLISIMRNRFSGVGFAATVGTVCRYYANVLLLRKAESLDPTIRSVDVKNTVFVLGLNRSGTTFFSNLLQAHPKLRSPLLCEMLYPYGPKGELLPGSDISSEEAEKIRERLTDKLLEFQTLNSGNLEETQLEWLSIHRQKANLPDEDYPIFEHTLRSFSMWTITGSDDYLDFIKSNEWRELSSVYPFHRRFLQHLQHQKPMAEGQRWLLKMPFHLFTVESLLQEYPEAQIIVLERDPVPVVGSWCSLTRHARKRVANRTTIESECLVNGKKELDLLGHMYEGIQKLREMNRPEQIRFIQYSDLIEDPMKQVSDVLKFLNLEDSEGTVRQYLHKNVEERRFRQKHEYSLSDYQLTEADVRSHFNSADAKGS